MVNTNIQGPVPLTGAGFVSRRNGNFQPGEFKRLSNVEVSDNGLINRRSVKSVAGTSQGSVIQNIENCLGFIGNMRTFSILASETEQVAVGPGTRASMWAPTLLTVPATDFSFHKLIGYFRFNNVNYWLTLEYDSAAHLKIKAYYGDIDIDNDVPSAYDAAYFATLTEVTLYTLLTSDKDFNKFEFKGFFLQGYRLWLVTSLGIYFSKATDPTIFAVPDGGFFTFPDQTVNYGISLRDAIYVMCDNSIFMVTYQTDPNLDSTVDQISDNVGGDWATVHQDAVYAINQVGIYRVLNNRVDKIVDNEFDVGEDYYKNSITSFEDYLVINKYLDVNYEKFTGESTSRVNLIPNPSVETNMTGWSTGNSYFTYTRTDPSSVDAFSGSWVISSRKITNTSVTVRTNLVENPSFETGVAKWDHDYPLLSPAADPPTFDIVGAGIEGGFRSRYLFNPSGMVSTTQVRMTAMESNYMPVVPAKDYRLLTNTQVGSDWQRNRLNLKVTVKYYDSSFNSIGYLTQDVPVGDEHLVWQTVNEVITVPNDPDIAYATVGISVEAAGSWLLKDAPEFRFFTDGWLFELESTYQYGGTTGYFDGTTADSEFRVFEWTGVAHESTSVMKGDNGTGNDAERVADYTSNIAVDADTSYTLGFAAMPTLGDRAFDVIIKQYDAGSNLLSSTTIFADWATVNEWNELNVSFTTGSLCANLRFEIHTFGPMFNGEFLRLDGFILETTETYGGYFDGSFADVGVVLTYAWSGVAHASTSTYTLTATQRRLLANGKCFSPGEAGNTLGYNVYFVNMVNGSIHVLEYMDARDAAEPGYIAEIVVNPNKDNSGNYNLFFITNRRIAETSSALTFKSNTYYMSSYKDTGFYDYAVKADNTLELYPPKIDVEIDSFVPDGSEYLVKKFRNCFIMAKFPKTGAQVQFGYDESGYGTAVDLTSEVIGNRPHHPYRIGVNQRAKSMSIRFTNDSWDIPATEGIEDYDVFQISDLRVLWSYTGHPVGVKNLT